MTSLSSKNILLISPESWSHIFVSKHHYAIELARRGHHVYFLNPPDPAHHNQLGMIDSGIERLYILNYPGQLKGMRFLPAIFRRQLNRQFLQRLEVLAGCRVDVVWNFENSRFFDLGFAGNRLKIYHQVDLNQDFHVKEAAASADICFCTSDLIRNVVAPYNKRVFKIHHGTSAAAIDAFRQKVSKNNDRVTALYIGNLDMPYLDHELLLAVVSNFQDVRFLLVGPYRSDGTFYRTFKSFQNIEWVGKVPAEDIPLYLEKADIFLVMYATRYHRDQSSPHKFMEYLASGKVIVATYTDEYKDKRDLLAMCEKNEAYPALFAEVVANLSQYNSERLLDERKAFALENSYARQLDRIIQYCDQIKPGSL
jgi:glycosyltransferase involved in cell wall biosynthesis